MAEEIKINVGADTSKLQAELVLAQNKLKQFQQALAKSTDIKDITRLQNSINTLEDDISSLQSAMSKTATSFNNVNTASGQANTTLVNLSRVVQDAPFGFMAISNNINPLIESFGRLKAESGSTGDALKGLLGGLTGGMGIGLGVSVVTSLLTTFSGSLSGTKTVIDDNSKSLEDLKANLDQISKGYEEASKDIEYYSQVQMKAYNGVNNLSDSYDGQKKSIEALRIAQRDVFDKSLFIANETLPRLKEAWTGASEAVSNYQYSLTQGSWESASAFQARKDALLLTDSFKNLQAAERAARDEYNKALETQKQLNQDQTLANLNLKNAEENLENLRKRDAAEAAKRERERIARLPTVAKELEKLAEKYRDIARLSKVTGEPFQEAFDIKFNPKLSGITTGAASLQEQANAVLETIKTLVEQFNLGPDSKVIIALNKDFARLQAAAAFDEFSKQIQQYSTQSKTIEFKLPVKLNIPKWLSDWNKAQDDQIKAAQKLLQEKQAKFQDIIVGLAQDSAFQIGELLGKGIYGAITGQADGLLAAFQGLFTLFGDAVIALGKYAILYSAAIEKLKAVLIKGGGVSGIAVGIGLIALGTLIKTAISGIGKKAAFATGTRYAPGGMALVGERGPELINLPRGSQVIPAAQTSQMMGGVQAVEVFGVLRGQDIYFSNKKYAKTYNRQT